MSRVALVDSGYSPANCAREESRYVNLYIRNERSVSVSGDQKS